MEFEAALYELKKGRKMAREGWNGKGMWVELQRPTDKSKNDTPLSLYENG